MTYETLKTLLIAPDNTSRGMTRWWWYGCCVEKEEIIRELDFMKEAGIGGVELQILYPVTPDDPEKGFYNIPYGSPEFFDVINFTVEECKKRGMVCDFTAGSCWPYGGPTVQVEDAQQQALPYQLDVHGPTKFSCDFTTYFAGNVCAAVMGKMENCVMLPETVVDITDKFEIKELFGWPWGTELAEIDIPEGDWKLVFFVISQHRNKVGKPSRDAEGPVIDHCSRRAADRFFHDMVKPVMERAPGIRSIFCDSIEVEGHNWSGVLLDEFEKRRGYDLKPYIYALWGDMGDITPHIRYDYYKTMSELTVENFFDNLTEFSHSHGAQCRIQAHGTWGDILRVYAAADIPEGETFGDHRTLEVNTIHRRLAASAGHLYGKNIISNETFTWLKRPRFTETLEEMKAAVDAVFLDGMNMIVNHGYAYSPEKAGKRGWPFYASTHINHTVPWWPLYKNLSEYIHRTSALLRWGHNVAEVAVYLPQADVWADNKMADLHLAMRLEEHMGRAEMDGIQKVGYWFDYINDEALTALGEMYDSALHIGENAYRVIILPGVTRLPVETARKLRDFVNWGGILLCDHIPTESCGYLNRDEETAAVRALMAEAKPVLLENRGEALYEKLHEVLVPDVTVSHPDTVGYVHRAEGDAHLYFLSNVSDEEKTVTASFKYGRGVPHAWSVNDTHPLPLTETDGGYTFVMAAHESIIVVFSPDMSAPLPEPVRQSEVEARLPVYDWRLLIEDRDIPLDAPVSWETMPGLAHYAGIGSYVGTIDVPEDGCVLRLTLEGLSAAARVYVDDSAVGDIWTHPLSLVLPPQAKGNHTLRIDAHSTLVNEMMVNGDYEVCPDVVDGWPYFGAVINSHRRARLNCRREHNEMKAPVRSGVWGTVAVSVVDSPAAKSEAKW
ncbi:MAG: hypothetical protein IJ449_07610 [Clostridia bacterium]|nr:hypothetical protein [Clostridia bacterium]